MVQGGEQLFKGGGKVIFVISTNNGGTMRGAGGERKNVCSTDAKAAHSPLHKNIPLPRLKK